MPGRVRFGLGPLTAQALDDTAASAAAEIDTLIAAAVAADEVGFDSIWVSEHHLAGDAYLTSPLVLLAALARETRRTMLGTDVALAPLYAPLRLAEEATLVDHLSGGRLMLGLGIGYRDVEYAAFGVARRSRVRRLEESVATMRAAWMGEPVGGATVSPAPLRTGGPPILVGGYAEPAVRRAGRIADGWIAPTMSGPEQLEHRLEWLAQDGAFERPFHIVVNIAAFVAADGAWERVRDGVHHVEERYRTWRAEDPSAPPRRVEPRHHHHDRDRRPPHVVVGDPATCAEKLRPWHEVLEAAPAGAIAHLNVRLHYPGVGRDATLRAVHLFAEEVVPRLDPKEDSWTPPINVST